MTFLPGPGRLGRLHGGTTGPQLLYAAIGGGNLRAWVQGADDVGYAALGS